MSEQFFAEEKQASFEARASSQEVRDLNSAAGIAISARLEDIRQDLSFSTDIGDREAWATAYAEEAGALIGEGYQLSQAKLIMDKRDERAERAEQEQVLVNKIMAQYRKNGLSENEAEKAFEDRLSASTFLASKIMNWDQKDAELKKVVRDEYIFTPEEYTLVQAEQARERAKARANATTEQLPKSTRLAAAKRENEIRLAERQETLDGAREEYARFSAARGGRTLRFSARYSKEDVAAAREHYEKCKKALGAPGPEDALEAFKLANAIAYARKVASDRWKVNPKGYHIHSTGKNHGAVPVLDETRPLARFQQMLRWGDEIKDDESIWSGRGGKEIRKRATVMAAGPASIGVGILLPPVGIGIIAGGSAWLASRAAKKILDLKPGYKPGRTVAWVIGREQDHRTVIWEAVRSVRRGSKLVRQRFDDAEIMKELSYAVEHADPADNPIHNLDTVIADMIDQETEGRQPVNQQKLRAQLGTAAVAATTASALAVF